MLEKHKRKSKKMKQVKMYLQAGQGNQTNLIVLRILCTPERTNNGRLRSETDNVDARVDTRVAEDVLIATDNFVGPTFET